MVDKTVTINETQKNLLRPYIASGGDIGNVVGLGFATGTGNESVTISTEQAYQGTKSIKVVCNGVQVHEGWFDINYGVSTTQKVNGVSGVTYTFSTYVYGTVGGLIQCGVWFRDLTASGSIKATQYIFGDSYTLVDGWQRISFTFTFPDVFDVMEVGVVSVTAQAKTFYLDCLQLEKGTVMTDWEMPDIGTVTDVVSSKQKVTSTDQFSPRNILEANVSDGTNTLGNATGYASWRNATFDTSLEKPFKDKPRSLKIQTPGVQGGEGINLRFNSATLPIIGTYTLSAWVWVPKDVYMMIYCGSTGPTYFYGTGDWQFIYDVGTDPGAYGYIGSASATPVTFYIARVQVEKGSTPSEWMSGNILNYNTQTIEQSATGVAKSNGNAITCTLTQSTSVSFEGTASAKLNVDSVASSGNWWMQINTPTLSLKGGKTYLFAVRGKYVRNGHNNVLNSYVTVPYDGANHFSPTKNPSGNWDYHYIVFTPDVDRTIQISLTVGANSADMMKAGDAWYWDDAWLVEYPNDNLQVKAVIPISEAPKNLAKVQIATGGDQTGTSWGFYRNDGGTTNTYDNTFRYQGNGCIKVVTDGATAWQGVYNRFTDWNSNQGVNPIIPGQTYTLSAWVYGDVGTLALTIREYNTNGAIISATNQYFNLNGGWQRISVTRTMASNGSNVMFLCTTNGTPQAITYWIDAIQFELGATATEWTYPSIGSPIENINPKNKLTIRDIENTKNKTYPNCATCGDTLGSTFGLYAHTGITGSYDVTTRHTGVGCFKGVATTSLSGKGLQPNNALPYNGFPQYIKPNTTYTCSLWVKSQIVTQTNMNILAECYNDINWVSQSSGIKTLTSGEWTRLSTQITTPATANAICISVRFDNLVAGDVIWCDDVQVEEGSILTDWEHPGIIDIPLLKTQIPVVETSKNLCNPYQATGGDSNFVTGSRGFQAWGTEVTYAVVTEDSWQGTKCQKVINTGASPNRSFGIADRSIVVAVGKTYTSSVYVKADANSIGKIVNIVMTGYNDTRQVYQNIGTSADFILDGTWQRFSYTCTVGAGYSHIHPKLLMPNTQPITMYVDGWQVEEGDTATEWTYPSITNAYDGLIQKNKLTITDNFTPRNMLIADVASCTDISGTTTSFGVKGTCTISSDNTMYYKGSRSLKINTNGYDADATFSASGLVVGQQYILSGMLNIPKDINMWLIATNIGAGVCVGTGTWQNYSIWFTATATTQEFRIGTYGTTQTQTFWADCLMLEPMKMGIYTPSEWQPGNILTYNQQTAEIDSVGVTGNGATLSRDTTNYYKGSVSFKGTANAVTNSSIDYGYGSNYFIPVQAGKTYLFSTNAMTSIPKNGVIYIFWFDSNKTNTGLSVQKSITLSTYWQNYSIIGQAPSNAAYVYLEIKQIGQNIGDAIWSDEAYFIEYPTDNLQIKSQISMIEQQGNLLNPNAATGGDASNTTSGHASNTSNAPPVRDLTTTYDGTGSIKITLANIDSYMTNLYLQPAIRALKPNTTYTISVWAKTTSVNKIGIAVYTYNSRSIAFPTVRGTNVNAPDWTLLTYTFTTNPETSLGWIGISGVLNNGESIWVSKAQLEEGATATAWKYPSIGVFDDRLSMKASITKKERLTKNLFPPNAARGTDHTLDTTDWYQINYGSISSTTEKSYAGSRSLKCVTSSTADATGCAIYGLDLAPGKTYTVSGWVWCPTGKSLVFYTANNSWNNYAPSTIITGNDNWQFVTYTFTNPVGISGGKNSVADRFICLSNYKDNFAFYLDQMQIEEGSVATEWVFPGAVEIATANALIPIPEGQERLTPIESSCTDISKWTIENAIRTGDGNSIIGTWTQTTYAPDIYSNRSITVAPNSYLNLSGKIKVSSTHYNIRLGAHCYDKDGHLLKVVSNGIIQVTNDFAVYSTGMLQVPNNCVMIKPCIYNYNGVTGDTFSIKDMSCIVWSGAESLAISNKFGVQDTDNLMDSINTKAQTPVKEKGTSIDIENIRNQLTILQDVEGLDNLIANALIPVEEIKTKIIEGQPVPINNSIENLLISNSVAVVDTAEFQDLINLFVKSVIQDSVLSDEQIYITNSFTLIDEGYAHDKAFKLLVHHLGNLMIVKNKDMGTIKIKNNKDCVFVIRKGNEAVILKGD
jgi:hypothetical protein